MKPPPALLKKLKSGLAALPELAKDGTLARDLVAMAQPCLALVPAGRSKAKKLRTAFGGAPQVPPSFEWPTIADGDDERFLNFLGQIDLAEVGARRIGLP